MLFKIKLFLLKCKEQTSFLDLSLYCFLLLFILWIIFQIEISIQVKEEVRGITYCSYYTEGMIYTDMNDIEKKLNREVYVITYNTLNTNNINISKLIYKRHRRSGIISSFYSSYSESILTKEDYDFIIQKLNK